MLKKEYNAVTYVSGPLLFLEGAADLAYGAIVNIDDGSGRVRGGQVIEVSDQYTVLQVFEETSGLNLDKTTVSLVEDVARLMLDRMVRRVPIVRAGRVVGIISGSDTFTPRIERAAPGARILLRSAHAHPDFLDGLRLGAERTPLRDALRFDDALARDLHVRDRVHTYAGFKIADVPV